MKALDGTWEVAAGQRACCRRWSAVHKRIDGSSGETALGPLPGVPFDVVGTELRYRRPFTAIVDRLEPDATGWAGRTLVRGREIGRFRLVRRGPVVR